MHGPELRRRIKEVIVEELMLELGPEEIEDRMPIFATGLGLDSVDALQLVIAIEKHFGLKVRNAEAAREVFENVESIAAEIEKQGT